MAWTSFSLPDEDQCNIHTPSLSWFPSSPALTDLLNINIGFQFIYCACPDPGSLARSPAQTLGLEAGLLLFTGYSTLNLMSSDQVQDSARLALTRYLLTCHQPLLFTLFLHFPMSFLPTSILTPLFFGSSPLPNEQLTPNYFFPTGPRFATLVSKFGISDTVTNVIFT